MGGGGGGGIAVAVAGGGAGDPVGGLHATDPVSTL